MHFQELFWNYLPRHIIQYNRGPERFPWTYRLRPEQLESALGKILVYETNKPKVYCYIIKQQDDGFVY